MINFNRFFVAAVFAMSALVLLTLPSCSPIADPISDDFDMDASKDINTLLDEHTDSEVDSGCDMTLLINGPVSRAAYRTLMESATDHINLSMWDIDDDAESPEQIGPEFVDLMIAKVAEGVLVNVILDPVAMNGYSDPSVIDDLIAGGVNVRLFMPPLEKILIDQFFYRTHKKFIVVDGKDGILGGMNFGYTYMAENQWRDTNVQVSGPVVATMQEMFFSDWADLGEPLTDRERFFPPLSATGDYDVRIIDQRPCHEDFDLNEAIRVAIRSASDHIDMEAPYFNPMPWLEDEIIAAVERGVDVRILTNSEVSNDMMASIYYITASYYQNMIDHGVEVYEWSWAGHVMHSKSLIVDDKFGFVGTYNFNYRSTVWDAECAVCFTDPEPLAQIQQMINDDIDNEVVVPITQAWIDAQGPDAQEIWDGAAIFRYISKEVAE